jgi:hypothetical protein
MPPSTTANSRITGQVEVEDPERVAQAHRFASRAKVRTHQNDELRGQHEQTDQQQMPGMMPAMNRSPMSCPATMP